jgi:CIC family chloride channel protein
VDERVTVVRDRGTQQPRLGRADWRPRLGDSIRHTRSGLVGLALLIGLGGGLGAVAFRELIGGFTRLASGRADYSLAGRAAHRWMPWLGPYFLLVVPVLAGLIYGPLIYRFAREARGHGVPEVMLAVAQRGGRISPMVAVVKSLASALCIGAGGSVGREGPIVQIGSALGSTAGQLARVPESRLRVLVGCGAAAGISATFNAPIAGVFFALELILRDFATESFGVVVLAAVAANVVSRAFFGSAVFLHLPPFSTHHVAEYGYYALLGLVAGAGGVLLSTVLYAIEDLCDQLWRGPEWARPAVGGLFLGGLLLALPEMYGVGYPVLGHIVDGRYAIGFLLVLLIGKACATSLTIGIGGSGGVFAPSLFCGAALGEAFGLVVQHVSPGVVANPGAYALVGMGALFSGAARAPITAVLILFELTGEYSIILPIMLAVVTATAVSKAITPDTIYLLKLRRRGIDLDKPSRTPIGARIQVGAVMGAVPEPLQAADGVATLLDRLADSAGSLPVVDQAGAYRGVVSAAAAESEAVDATARDPSTQHALDLATLPPALREDDTLDRAVELLAGTDGAAGVPVLDQEGRITGWMTHQRVLQALHRRTSPVNA